MREVPDISLAEIKGYAKLIAHGWDTIKETFNMNVPDLRCKEFDRLKEKTLEEYNGTVGVSIPFGGETLTLKPRGTRSAIYVLENDDFRIFIRSPKMDWCVSVEYAAAGLWEYGLEALRERVLACLLKELSPRCGLHEIDTPKVWQRISVAHFAFDFHSPAFSEDMQTNGTILNRIVCPAACKKALDFKIEGSAWANGTRFETLTIGKKNRVQVQIYDKGKEITDVSGKTWMFKVWDQEGYTPPPDKKAKDVWRLEVRFGADFLRDRGVLTIFDLQDNLPALLTEGLFTRRLTVQSLKDTNRCRWPLHPLYVEAYHQIGAGKQMMPLGRQQTESHKAMAYRLKQNVAGNLRALTVLSKGDMDEEHALKLVDETFRLMIDDPGAERKTEQARRRYMYVREAA